MSSAQTPNSASRPGPISGSSRGGRLAREREGSASAPAMASTSGAVASAHRVPERGQPWATPVSTRHM
eukprot:4545678-Pyramimonas_sp.AAC.1